MLNWYDCLFIVYHMQTCFIADPVLVREHHIIRIVTYGR